MSETGQIGGTYGASTIEQLLDKDASRFNSSFNDPMYWGESGNEFFKAGAMQRFGDAYKGLQSERDALLGKVDANRAGDIALESQARADMLKNLAKTGTYKSFNPYK